MAKATRTNNRKSRDQKPADPERVATVEELAAMEFEPLPEMKIIEERLNAEQWGKLGMSVRLAYVTMRKTKAELVQAIREMGADEAENMMHMFQTSQERGRAISDLSNSAEIRIMCAMAFVGMEQEAATEHPAK